MFGIFSECGITCLDDVEQVFVFMKSRALVSYHLQGRYSQNMCKIVTYIFSPSHAQVTVSVITLLLLNMQHIRIPWNSMFIT